MRNTLLATVLLVTGAEGAEVHFCWQGDGGYSILGSMQFPDDLTDAHVVTEADVTAFEMTGYHDGIPIGGWSLAARQPHTSWMLTYDPGTMTFAVGGRAAEGTGQAWNANGWVTDCGTPGFGFNAESHEQDICVDGIYYPESGIAPDTPLRGHLTASATGCAPLLSMKGAPRRHG